MNRNVDYLSNIYFPKSFIDLILYSLGFKLVPVRVCVCVYKETDKLFLLCIWEYKEQRLVNSISRKKSRGSILPDIKITLTIIIKKLIIGSRNRYI